MSSMSPGGAPLIPFRGDVDLAALVASVPPTHTIKGTFVASNAAIVASDWEKVARTLVAPPRAGKYLAFSDYPLTDFLRISDAAARKQYPEVGTREAHRRLARNTFDVFAATTLGRVALAMVSGPASLLAKYAEMFNRMLNGPRLSYTSFDASTGDLEYTAYFSTREAIFGVIEGAVMACRYEPTVNVAQKGDGHYVARVTWTPS